MRRCSFFPVLLFVLGAAPAQVKAPGWLPASFDPPWAGVPAKRRLPFPYDGNKTSIQNGAALVAAMQALQPGDRLLIGPGTYSMASWVDLKLAGTAAAPVRIEAADPQRPPVLTRPDARQNVLNLGVKGPARHLALQGLEFTGGADLLKLYDCENIWIDRCHLHDGGGVGIAANTVATRYIHITRNEIARPGGPGDTGEGMYLGSHSGSAPMSWSVVALNHVHHTAAADQGDGIELKQNSHHNWIAGNHVHHTRYPCLIVYGTGGMGENVLEGNILYTCLDNVLQVQGEALVRNNLVMDGAGAGFQSHDHQGMSRDLVFVHNTIITPGRGANLASWNGRPGMVLANNLVYSRSSHSLRFPAGSTGVAAAGNVVVGPVTGVSGGWVPGGGLADFVAVTWDAVSRNAVPARGSPAAARGVPAYRIDRDLAGGLRRPPVDPGAYDGTVTFTGDRGTISLAAGGTQRLGLDGGTALAGGAYQVVGTFSGAMPGLRVEGWHVALNPDPYFELTLLSPNQPLLTPSTGRLDGAGRASCLFLLPPALPAALLGLTFHHAFVVLAPGLRHASNPVELVLVK